MRNHLRPDGKKIYLINNGGGTANTHKITVYTYVEDSDLYTVYPDPGLKLSPNPSSGIIQLQLPENKPYSIQIVDSKEAKITEVKSESESMKRIQRFVKD